MGKTSQSGVQKQEYLDMKAKFASAESDVEKLSIQYHGWCKELVQSKPENLIVKPTQPFIEYKDLSEDQKEGRRFLIRQLLKSFILIPK